MTPSGQFRPDDGAFVAHLDAPERALLVHLVDEVVSLLGGPAAADVAPFTLSGAPVPAPVDPAVRRLLPDASRADPEMAAEFRRLTEADLRGAKVTQLLVLRAALADDVSEVVVQAADAPAAAAALTDVRLVAADRLGLRTDADADALQAMVEAEPRCGRRRDGRDGRGPRGACAPGARDGLRPARPPAGDPRRLPPRRARRRPGARPCPAVPLGSRA